MNILRSNKIKKSKLSNKGGASYNRSRTVNFGRSGTSKTTYNLLDLIELYHYLIPARFIVSVNIFLTSELPYAFYPRI